ncbi:MULTISPECIES: Hsp20/alpha crystallin family protein [unclassified Streptomyces]|uniref:Hsp20/alpha crystallin family protein n=1 Tax=unclassified Streptomyces TaxID=2593676 RepID=UPI0018F69AD5|nr:Hsp20/alpha crystallin family protein [Streptomyces sp. DSM 110735]MBJ7907296.1 Hsp20/alpha crystallin family protein [Streptomyces sp. DSM 110735]
MLMRTDPFRELDRIVDRVWGTAARPAGMPMDAWREGDTFVVELDLPGVTPESIDLDVERNVLTVRADRRPAYGENAETVITERPAGTFSRQLFLGETLDSERIDASYEAGVLRLRIPVADQAKPRKIAISGGDTRKEISS